MRTLFRAALISLAIGIAACSPRVDAPQLGLYRAVLRLPGGDAPFGLEVAQEQQQNTLRATMNRDSLEGSVTLIKAGGKEQVIPFVAKLGETYRFYAKSSTDNADVDGTWDATFTNEKGETSKAILLFEQGHDHVTGSVMTPTGDHRFLEGQVHGEELQVSTFAGGLACLAERRAVSRQGRVGHAGRHLVSKLPRRGAISAAFLSRASRPGLRSHRADVRAPR
jgi:hypothetical protein